MGTKKKYSDLEMVFGKTLSLMPKMVKNTKFL